MRAGERTLLKEKYRSEIDHLLLKFPADQKRSAVMPLLFLAQRDARFVQDEAICEIAEILELESTQVRSIIGFYTLYHAQAAGKYRIQVCNDLPCALRGSEHFAQQLSERLGIGFNETTADGLFTLEAVMCLAACDRAPVFQLQGPDGVHYHEYQTVDSAMQILEDIRKRESHD